MLKKIFIFVILALTLSSKMWLDRFYKISFDIQTEKQVDIQVFYLKNFKNGFSEKYSVKTSVAPGPVQNIKLRLPIEKLKKIRIDIGSNPGNVKMSNIYIKGVKHKKLKLDNFLFNQIDSHNVDNGTLLLSSIQNDPFLVYKDKRVV